MARAVQARTRCTRRTSGSTMRPCACTGKTRGTPCRAYGAAPVRRTPGPGQPRTAYRPPLAPTGNHVARDFFHASCGRSLASVPSP